MVRSPCCDEDKGVKKGPWTPEEDEKLREYISNKGFGNWRSLPKLAGLNRCGKSCRLRWMNYLRPDIRRGNFSDEEEKLIVNLHAVYGNKWSKIASHLSGRTDNEIKNYWNTHIRKKLLQIGIDPNTHKPRTDLNQILDLVKVQLLNNILHNMINPKTIPNIGYLNTNAKPAEGPFNNTLYPQFLTNPLALSTPQSNMDRLPALVSIAQENWNTKPVNTQGNDQTGISVEPGLYGNDKLGGEVPSLASGSSHEITGLNEIETAQLTSGLEAFENWEKLLDDETSDSCWKSFLDLTSPKSSPVAW